MKTVWKYPLPMDGDVVQVEMPAGARILRLDVQHDRPQLWVYVDDAEERHLTRRFRFAGTGHPLEVQGLEGLVYVGSFQLDGGAFVGHVFEILPAGYSITREQATQNPTWPTYAQPGVLPR